MKTKNARLSKATITGMTEADMAAYLSKERVALEAHIRSLGYKGDDVFKMMAHVYNGLSTKMSGLPVFKV